PLRSSGTVDVAAARRWTPKSSHDGERRTANQMCGIFGYVGARDAAPQLVLAGLKRLEYRGYDSWGIAARQASSGNPSRLLVEKHVGKIGQATTSLPASRAALG